MPDAARIPCSDRQPCPGGFTCRSNLGICVPLTALAMAPVDVSGGSVAPDIGNAATRFTATFQVSAPLGQTPSVYAARTAAGPERYAFTCGACSPAVPCTCSYSDASAGMPAEGTLAVWVALTDAVGNAPTPTPIGTVIIDLVPPSVVGTATLSFVAPTGLSAPVSALGPAGTARVCFTVSELLVPAVPPVWAAGPGDAGVLGLTVESGYPDAQPSPRYCYDAALDGGAGLDGAKVIAAVLQDPAGNRTSVVLVDADGGLVVDTVPPAAPDMSADGGLVFHRAPWGELPDLTRPVFTLGATGAAIPSDGTLLVYADPARRSLVAQAAVRAGPLVPPWALPASDSRAIYVDLVDAAGNFAPAGPFLVENEEWVATLGGKVVGDAFSNPHECRSRPVFGPALVQGDDLTTRVAGPASDGGLLTVTGAATWRGRVQGFPGPFDPTGFDALAAVALTHDTARGQALALVSTAPPPPLAVPPLLDLWGYDGAASGCSLRPAMGSPPGSPALSRSRPAIRSRSRRSWPTRISWAPQWRPPASTAGIRPRWSPVPCRSPSATDCRSGRRREIQVGPPIRELLERSDRLV